MTYNRALNVACLGWALALIAVTLNVLSWAVTYEGIAKAPVIAGIAFGILTLAASYFGDSYASTVQGIDPEREGRIYREHMGRARLLQMASIGFCVLSYLCWLAGLEF